MGKVANVELPPVQYGINWEEMAKKTGQKFVPRIQRLQYCAYHGIGDVYAHRKARIEAFWPEYQWHRWNERRLKADVKYNWLTWLGPASSAKSTDAAVFGLEYWLQAPDRTAVIICSTTMKMLRMRIWSQVAHYHQRLPKDLGHTGDLLDAATRIRWKHGDDRHAIFGIAVEEGSVEETVNNLIGVKAERVLLIFDEMQAAREAILRATFNMVANPIFRFRGMGNPDSLTNPLGRESEPLDGWDSVVRGETEEWETHGGPTKGHGLCQFFDGRKSPADDSPEEKKRLHWLCNREWYEGIVKGAKGNENDPRVWQMGIGWPPPMGLESTLLDDAIVTTFHCRDKAVWTHGFKKCAALDPAYGGGDKKILTFIYWGEAENDNGQKRWVIEARETVDVPIDAESERPIHYQIVDFCKVECERRGIGPTQFVTLTAGEGGGLHSIFLEQWGPVMGIEEGGTPGDDPVGELFNTDGSQKTEKQTYDTRASAQLFKIREFAQADGLRGLTNEITFQACNRRTFYRNGKWCAEPKVVVKGKTDEKGNPIRGYKQRMGHSPDELDSFKAGVAYCVLNGAFPKQTLAPEPKESESYYGQQQQDEFSPDNYLKGYSYA